MFTERALNFLHLFAREEFSRLVITALILVFVPLGLKLVNVTLSRKKGTLDERLERQVIVRNVIIISASVALAALWGSKIAGFALSLAAVAGAILIVSKEAILNLIGFIQITISRPFGFGDYVEIGHASGRVVDINAMTTTLVETRQGNQITGATVSVPNAAVITQAVRNLTVTGEFVVFMLEVKAPRNADILLHEQALIEAANQVCGAWQKAADEHLDRLERERHVDLPSADMRVVITLDDAKMASLNLRYTCRPNDRVKVEQQILRHYIAATREEMMRLPAAREE